MYISKEREKKTRENVRIFQTTDPGEKCDQISDQKENTKTASHKPRTRVLRVGRCSNVTWFKCKNTLYLLFFRNHSFLPWCDSRPCVGVVLCPRLVSTRRRNHYRHQRPSVHDLGLQHVPAMLIVVHPLILHHVPIVVQRKHIHVVSLMVHRLANGNIHIGSTVLVHPVAVRGLDVVHRHIRWRLRKVRHFLVLDTRRRLGHLASGTAALDTLVRILEERGEVFPYFLVLFAGRGPVFDIGETRL